MSTPEQKLAQYLLEARASEHALTRVLQSQIAMTPQGAYRSALEDHLEETRRHARRVGQRLRTLQTGFNPVTIAVGLWEDAFGQGAALAKAPFDMLRGGSGEEKVLKNAKDTCATEALEIATYTALERLARRLGDRDTAEMAAEILGEEQRMLDRVLQELPRLTDAVVAAEIEGDGSFDVTETGAADRVRATASGGVDDGDLPIAGYDDLTAEQIVKRLPGLSQADLATVDAYERSHQDRTTILERIESLRGDEPWPGYDDQNVADVQARLTDADEDQLRAVRDYERAHKNRAGVLRATERHLTA